MMNLHYVTHYAITDYPISDEVTSDERVSTLPSLLFDKVSIVGTDITPDRVKTACRNIQLLVEDRNLGLVLKPSSGFQVYATAGLPLSSQLPQTVVMQAGSYSRGVCFRMEFNPAKLGYLGISDLNRLLELIFETPAEEFWRSGKVTRADIAVDLHGHSLNATIVYLKRARKHGVYIDQTGEVETVYLGGARGSRAAVYNRKGEGGPCLRVERRLKPQILVPDLVALRNPFPSILAVPTSVLRPLITEHHPDTLFDSSGFGASPRL